MTEPNRRVAEGVTVKLEGLAVVDLRRRIVARRADGRSVGRCCTPARPVTTLGQQLLDRVLDAAQIATVREAGRDLFSLLPSWPSRALELAPVF